MLLLGPPDRRPSRPAAATRRYRRPRAHAARGARRSLRPSHRRGAAARAGTRHHAVGHPGGDLHLGHDRPVQGRALLLPAGRLGGACLPCRRFERPQSRQPAAVPCRRHRRGLSHAGQGRLDRAGRGVRHQQLLGRDAPHAGDLPDTARRNGAVPAQGAAQPARPRPSAEEGRAGGIGRRFEGLRRPLRRRRLHHLQHDRDLLAAGLRAQPVGARHLRPAARGLRGAHRRRERLRAGARHGRRADRAQRHPMVDEPRLSQQSRGDGNGVAQRLVSHRRRLPARRGRQFLLRRPAEGRDSPARREHLLLRGRSRGQRPPRRARGRRGRRAVGVRRGRRAGCGGAGRRQGD